MVKRYTANETMEIIDEIHHGIKVDASRRIYHKHDDNLMSQDHASYPTT